MTGIVGTKFKQVDLEGRACNMGNRKFVGNSLRCADIVETGL